MKFDYGFRLDMGSNIGSGHFYRCLAVAKELKKNNKKIIFLVSNNSNLSSHLSEKIPYYILKGKSEREKITNAKELFELIRVLIVDLPTQNEFYSKFLKNQLTVLFDDLGKKTVNSELVFNGQIEKSFHHYSSSKKQTRYFLGGKYMILRKGFFQQRLKTNLQKNKLKKILLTFGGGDPNNFSKKILKGLPKNNFDYTLIVGPTYSKKMRINFLQKFSKLIIKSNVQNPEKLFSKQDLVICTVGITVYELACLGIPCIMISFTSEQELVAKRFSENGYGVNYGYWDNDFDHLNSIITKFENHSFKQKMYKNGRKIIDGKGLERITKTLLQL